MRVLVHGIDADGSGQGLVELADAHWDYMDLYADRLIARGPTLTPDGSEHTGSVHVVDVPTLEDARRFAHEEPYTRAGLYASVTVTRIAGLLDGTMWDRPGPNESRSILVLARWDASAWPGPGTVVGGLLDRLATNPSLVFGGLLLTDDADGSRGLLAVLDEPGDQVAALRADLVEQPGLTVDVTRWRRGGRAHPARA